MFIRTYQAAGSKRRWVRCLLLPRQPIGSSRGPRA